MPMLCRNLSRHPYTWSLLLISKCLRKLLTVLNKRSNAIYQVKSAKVNANVQSSSYKLKKLVKKNVKAQRKHRNTGLRGDSYPWENRTVDVETTLRALSSWSS